MILASTIFDWSTRVTDRWTCYSIYAVARKHGSRHMAYCHALLIDLYLHTKFHWNQKKTFVDRDVDIHLSLIYIIRSTCQLKTDIYNISCKM